MAGEESKKSRQIARLRERYPEKKFEDEEEIYGQISDDYDQYDERLTGYAEREKALSDMFSADPRSAQFLVDMHKGEDPVVGLVRNFGIEIKDALEDPEMQEKIKEANKDYVERVAKSRALEEEYESNMDATLESLRQFQAEKGLTDEQIDEVVAAMLGVITDGVKGKFTPETLEMFLKAINYNEDVALANEEGTIAGRNAKITETLKKSQKGDGTQPLGGRNGGTGGDRGQTIFDLANEAM
ncbi:MAG: hypothetical protein J1D77_03670 [Muribaculaceae bacterium]|nr:hypothetical protein [Muribaculaceae bacterium]